MGKRKKKFRSKFEKTIANILKTNKVEAAYEPFTLPYVLNCNYTPDFVVRGIVIEAKGVLTPADRKKMCAVKKSNPDLDIRLWFMKDNYLSNKTKATRYSDWAKKNGFPFHVGETFPEHWFLDEV